MFSPGTVKALGLIAKGVNPESAKKYAAEIDNQAAEARLNFYSQQSLSTLATSSLPTPSTLGSTVPASVTPNSTQTFTTKDFTDMIKSGEYKRNTTPLPGESSKSTSYLNRPIIPVEGPPTDLVVQGSKKKLSTFYDSRFVPTTEELAEQAKVEITPTTNISKNLLKGRWGVRSANDDIQVAVENITNILTKGTPKSTQASLTYIDSTPEQKAEAKKQKELKNNSITSMASSFIKEETNIDKIKSDSNIINKEIENQLSDLKTQEEYYAVQGKRMVDVDSARESTEMLFKIGARRKELIELKNNIDETYQNKVYNRVGKQIAANLKSEALKSPNLDNYLKSLDKYKDRAGGLANSTTDFSGIIKQVNKGKYLDRPLTEQDLKVGGEAVLNEQALARFNQKTSLSVGEAIAEDRYNNTRDHIVGAHYKIGEQVARALQDENNSIIKKQEQLVKLSQDPNISADKLKQIDGEFKKLGAEIDLNNRLIEKTNELHNYESLDKNKEIQNFAGSYLADQKALMKESAKYYSDDLSWFSKGLWISQITAGKLLSGTAKLGLDLLQGAGSMTGWDGLATTSRRISNYVTVPDLINFDRSNNAGNYQTSSQFMFTDKKGERHYQPSALLYTGAETAPLVIATVYGASGLTSLAGRALAANRTTLVTKGLMSAKRSEQFTRALATTRNYGAAYRTTLAQSNNALVRGLAYQAPNSLALGTLIYPSEFARTYEDLYRKGITDARSKAHAVAAVSTAIEMISEITPNLKYLDDFAEKGTGLSKLLNKNKYLRNWNGSVDQYRTLYGDVFGKAFSNKTLDYLAANSAKKLGTAGAVGRFIVSRGVEEGIEEVFAELAGYFADNHMGMAAMKGEPPAELELQDVVNAFTGALLGPPIGVGTQIKKYQENKHFGQLFDIMLNGQYYKNKISQGLKEGKITHENAAIALSKIQELEAVEQEYGIKNLKQFQSVKSIETLQDLMEDPTMQFDYFKKVLQKRQIDDKLSKLETSDYTDQQKQDLIAQAEEAERTISDYKKRSDFYSQMSEQDKKDVLDKNIARKLQLSKRGKTESIEKLEKELEDYTAQAVANKRPDYYLESVRAYRDNLSKIRLEREQAEENAMSSGQYNPIIDHIENKTPQSSLADIESAEDLEDMLVQAILSPDRGTDILALFSGAYDQQLEALDLDTERITEDYINQLRETGQLEGKVQSTPDGGTEIQEGGQDPGNGPRNIEFLTEAQQDELNEMLSELNSQYDDILNRKNQVAEIITTALNSVFPKEIAEIEDVDARTKAIDDFISNIYNSVFDKYLAAQELFDEDENLSQDVLYSRLKFDEYLADNTQKYNKAVEKYKKEREAKGEKPNVEATRQEVSVEVTNEDGTKERIDVPELTPQDADAEFIADIEELENTPATMMTSTTSEAAGDIISQEEYNKNRGVLLQRLLDKVLASPNINSAKAKMFSIMEAAGVDTQEIKDTLDLLDKVSNNEPVLEENYTHMFNLLLIKAGSLNALAFAQPTVETSTIEAPPITATNTDTRTPEQIESTTVIPNVTLKSLEGKEVIYNGVRGTLIISPGGVVTVETDNVVYELEGANPETSTLEHMIQEYKPEAEIKPSDIALSETEVVLDGVEYIMQTDNKGNVVALRDKTKPQKRITTNKLLIRAEIARNRLEHEVLTDMAEETPEELAEAVEEAKAQFNSAVVVENVFAYNLSETVAEAIEKLYEDGNSRNLSDAELLQTELWLMDTWSRLDDLAREYLDDEIIQNALENITIINQLLYNGKPAKAPRKTRSKKSTEAKEKRTAPKKTASKKSSKSPIVKESVKPTQLTIDFATGVSPTLETTIEPTAETSIQATLPFETITPVEVTPESNVEEAQANVNSITENIPAEPKPDVLPATPIVVETLEEKKDKEDNKKQTLSTNPLKMFLRENNPDNPFLQLQEKIIQSIDQEFFSNPNTAIVDLFTLIEETLGSETLTKMQNIFNEVQAGVSEEQKAELRKQFISLFPTSFMRPGNVEYMFDTQIVGKVSQSNVTQVDQRRLDADEYEIYLANRGRRIPEVETKDGRKFKNLLVRQSEGKLLLLYKEDVLDAENKKIGETETWIRYDQIKNPENILAYPIQGNAPIQFNDLNVLTFTLLDSNGQVQKFDSLGNKNNSGNKALLLYLPTSKNKAKPTEQQKAMDGLRMSLTTGARVKQSAPLVRPSYYSGTQKDAATNEESRIDYIFEFSTGPMIPMSKTMDKGQIEEQKSVTETIAEDNVTQESSIIALEKVIALAKSIPDPTKEGYLINGKRYERQSRFVDRALGKEKTQTEDSVLSMELGAAVGNLLDIIGRDILGGAKVKTLKEYIKEAESMGKSLRDGKGYKLNISEAQFNQLVSELREIAQELTSKGWKIFTEGLVVYREFTEAEKKETGFEGVAGAMDIVAVDPDGGVHIIDFKNKKFKSEDHFKSSMYLGGTGYPSNVSKWGTQQTTYGILSKDFGLPIKSINILAFASQYTLKDDTITIDSLTKGTKRVPVLPQNVSPISDSIIKLKYDHTIAKQLELRTAVPVKQKVKEAAEKPQEKDLSKIKEQLGETREIDVKNTNLVLSSLNIDLDNLLDDIDPLNSTPDNLNPPPCS